MIRIATIKSPGNKFPGAFQAVSKLPGKKEIKKVDKHFTKLGSKVRGIGQSRKLASARNFFEKVRTAKYF